MEGQVTEDNLKGDKNEVPTLEEQVENKDGQCDTDQKEDINDQVHRANDNMKDDEVNEDKEQDKEDQIEIIEIS